MPRRRSRQSRRSRRGCRRSGRLDLVGLAGASEVVRRVARNRDVAVLHVCDGQFFQKSVKLAQLLVVAPGVARLLRFGFEDVTVSRAIFLVVANLQVHFNERNFPRTAGFGHRARVVSGLSAIAVPASQSMTFDLEDAADQETRRTSHDKNTKEKEVQRRTHPQTVLSLLAKMSSWTLPFLERPKSVTATWPTASTRTFSSLTSRCTTPRRWRCSRARRTSAA
mmetsp:Transcript_12294/g.37131  ORF Transcript_12294/g.37131 Transcript_12294/m.37131 type:complete len:223 (-) Transcript_12294:1880-2548(-)